MRATSTTARRTSVQLLNIGSLAGVFASLAGILVVTSETRFGTIRPTFLVTPSWLRILGLEGRRELRRRPRLGHRRHALLVRDRLRVPVAARHPDGCSGAATSPGCSSARSSDRRSGAASASGIGTVIRNQIGAVIVFLAFAFVLENILFGLVPSVGRYMPLQAQNAFEGSNADHMLRAGLGGLVLLGWMAGLVALGLRADARTATSPEPRGERARHAPLVARAARSRRAS